MVIVLRRGEKRGRTRRRKRGRKLDSQKESQYNSDLRHLTLDDLGDGDGTSPCLGSRHSGLKDGCHNICLAISKACKDVCGTACNDAKWDAEGDGAPPMTDTSRSSTPATLQREGLSAAATAMWTEIWEWLAATRLGGKSTKHRVVVEYEVTVVAGAAAHRTRGHIDENALCVYI
jgi:hypothetical protein